MARLSNTVHPSPRVAISCASVSEHLIQALEAEGTQHAFGVMGGALVPIHAAMRSSALRLVHCRHETGAVYAALEASLSGGVPAVAFVTTGPGVTNAITGAVAARQEGAHLLLISGCTGPAAHGRYGLQETHAGTLLPGLYQPGAIFDAAWTLTDARMLDTILRQLRTGWQRPQGFVAHLAIPLDVQKAPVPVATAHPRRLPTSLTPAAGVLAALNEPTALWIGYGARRASPQVRALAESLGAPVISTPRAKGIFPEDHPQYLGVAGSFGSDPDLAERLQATGVRQVLVLGTRLGEFSVTAPAMAVFARALHVDLDPRVPGAAWPMLPTIPIVAEIGAWLEGVLATALPRYALSIPPRPVASVRGGRVGRRVRPQAVMAALQQRVVDASRALVMAESGNSFAWTTRLLRFSQPGRYRQAGAFAPMGQVSAGAIGAALATHRPVVAVVGDGALLMQNEISTAVGAQARVIWVVLNDARYGMVEQGLDALDQPTTCQRFPQADFARMAEALGARGRRICDEAALDGALRRALLHPGPTVLDVVIDPEQPAPHGARVQSIRDQSASSSLGE